VEQMGHLGRVKARSHQK